MTQRGHHWFAAALMAVLLHGAVVAWWLAADDSEGARAAGHDGMQVSVGLAGSFSEPSQPSQVTQDPPSGATVEMDPATPAEPKPKPEPIAEAEQQPESEPVHESKSVQAPLPEALPVPELHSNDATASQEPAPRVTRPVARAPARPVPKRQAEHQSKPVAEAGHRTGRPPERPAEQQAKPDKTFAETTVDATSNTSERSSIKATGTGQRVETGGNPAARQSYLAEILARIAHHKRYPREARHDGVTGVVTVTFTITANGTVLTQQVSGSSGDHRLDQAALDMLLRASPLPPIPRDMGVASLELTLPVEFSLNQKRKIF